MAKLKYLIIHCTDTPPTMEVSEDDIDLWHKGAKYDPITKLYRFMGHNYTKDKLAYKYLKLSSGKIVNALQTNGRGWSVQGYAKMYKRDGSTFTWVKDDGNQWIKDNEITNGARGINKYSSHKVLVGGKDCKFTDAFLKNYTTAQFVQLESDIKEYIAKHPQIKIGGHYQFSAKQCPGFNVRDYLKIIGTPLKNIL